MGIEINIGRVSPEMAVFPPDYPFIFFAHSNGQDPEQWQTLADHLRKTAEIAAFLGEPVGLGDHARIPALFHDLGKYSKEYQWRIRGKGPKTDHATAGAKEIIKLLKNTPLAMLSQAYAFCIAGHHTGLPDFGSFVNHESEPTLQARLKRKVADYQDYSYEFPPSELLIPALPRLKPTTKTGAFTLSFFVRMLYSILVDADFMETERFYRPDILRGNYPPMQEIARRFQQHLETVQFKPSPINDLRNEILNACKQRANDPQGLFSLTVPTGGGKTISSMSFALEHAKKHNLQRIIYVIPYTNIIEQNAQVFKAALGSEVVLEHHSNFDWENFSAQGKIIKDSENHLGDDSDNDILKKLKLTSENWDIPVVVTTNVQFFESLFAFRSSRSRKVHNMANSVIIFDETQMLPMEYLQPCLLAIAELVMNYRSTAVLCTATQPELKRFLPDDLPITEIAPDPKGLYNAFKRVRLQNLGLTEDEMLVERILEHEQVFCIVNTRKHAKKIFELLPKDGSFHLSTLMTASHRGSTIEKINERLENGLTCRVISTQLIEAGVDLDFPVGFRALAGLDSIIQAGGRVNRNRRRKEADLYIFEPVTDAIKRVPGIIAETGDVTRQILRRWQQGDPISLEAIHDYYESLYRLHSQVAFDSAGVLACFEKSGLRDLDFDFREAAERFRLIRQDSVGIIVPHTPDAVKKVEQLKWAEYPTAILRALQPFIVNVYRNEFQLLCESGKIDMTSNFPVLIDLDTDYDQQFGLKIPATSGGDAIFFDD